MALGALALLMWSGLAAAAETDSPAVSDAVEAIDTIVRDVRTDAVAVTDVDASVVAGEAVVEFSGDAEDGVAIAVDGGGDLELGLPFAEEAAEGEIVDGSVVYDNNNGSTTTPLVHDDGSVQILTTIADDSAPTAYEYVVEAGDGESLELTADGGAIAVGVDGVATASIAPPWAYDATGVAVPTWYEVSGDSLIQHIEHAGAAYPVVADPKISFGWKMYIKYNKSETKTISAYTPYATLSVGVCPGLGFAGTACVAGLGAYSILIDETFNNAAAQGKCVEFSQPYYPSLPTMIAQLRWKVVSC